VTSKVSFCAATSLLGRLSNTSGRQHQATNSITLLKLFAIFSPNEFILCRVLWSIRPSGLGWFVLGSKSIVLDFSRSPFVTPPAMDSQQFACVLLRFSPCRQFDKLQPLEQLEVFPCCLTRAWPATRSYGRCMVSSLSIVDEAIILVE
jgi:hypothetical protein